MKTNPFIMKRTISKIVLLLAIPLTVTAWAAETALPTASVVREERGVQIKHASAPMQEVTFIGLVTRNADDAVAAQLQMPKETGLVVVEVVPDGPAAGVLNVHDVLVRLDDQVLIESRQLGVLVRSHKEGDEVTLTYYRAGKQQTARVKLAKHQVTEAGLKLPPNKNKFFARTAGEPFGPSTLAFREVHPGEMRISKIEHKDAVMVFEDGKGRLEVSHKDGKKFLTARNDKNEVIFSGPVDTPDQRKAMPQEVRERLEKMESTDVRIPAPPLPPKPGFRSSATTIHGNGEMPEPFELSFDEDSAS
ncbi:MAG: PDZ domain-containing protein [Nibricoccus sp.]